MSTPRKGRDHSPQRHGQIKGLSSYSVRRSRVHGRGLFARTPYMRGDLIGEYRGRVIDVALEGETSSAWNSDPAYTLLFAIDDDLTIDAGVKGNSIRFMNHSCDPNCETYVEGDRVFVHARRRIRPGEELTYDYNLQPGDPSDSLDAYACKCGSKMCRGTMIDRDLLQPT
ncbi:MAG: SET domain-containing protein [Chloroflexi bacterium]|nr:MAG: SET domain-containing protein [Chloroflexota bacterium]